MADKVKVTTLPQMIRAAEYAKAYHDNFFATQMVAATPNCYRRAELMTPDKTTITVHANTQVNINGNGYISTEDVTLALGDVVNAAGRAGTDMYVYACEPSDSSTEPVFVVSANSTVPDGYNADNSRKIGGFHCLCADVGTISGHELSGYVAGDILPRSVWDLLHRAASENEGMVWVEDLNAWFDIYAASYDGEKLVSAYGGSVVSGTTGGKYMHGEMMAETFALIKKRLIWRDEYLVFSKGGNECTNVSGSANPGTTGGHVDTENRRLISKYGLEDCVGTWLYWTSDLFGVFNSVVGSSYSTTYGQYGGADASGGYYADGYREDAGVASNEYGRSWNSDIDGDNKYGGWWGGLVRFLAGRSWTYGQYCGSRGVGLNDFSTRVRATNAGRGASGPRCVNTL